MYLGLPFKWNQFGSNNSRHTSSLHKGLHAGKWTDLMSSKPDAVSTLEYHWTDYTGTTVADPITQWSSSGNLELTICIIGTHWKIIEDTSTLVCHWNHNGWCKHPVVSQRQSSGNLHNWNTTKDHWGPTENTMATNISFSSGIPVYTGV